MPEVIKRLPKGDVCSRCRHNYVWVKSKDGLCWWCDPKGHSTEQPLIRSKQ